MRDHKHAIEHSYFLEKDPNCKFDHLFQLELKEYTGKKLRFSNNSKLCVVYTVWSNHYYVKFLYLSLLSQLKTTDIEKQDIRIFTDETCHEYITHLLAPLIDKSKIIVVPQGLSLKYAIPLHSELKKFEKLVFFDSDAFVLGKQTNFYSTLLQLKGLVYMYQLKGVSGVEMFNRRKRDLPTTYDMNDFFDKKWIQNLISSNWHLSGFTMFDRRVYQNSNGGYREEYVNHIIEPLFKHHRCDETIWLSYLYKMGYEVHPVNNIVKWVDSTTFKHFWDSFSETRDASFVHPVEGEFSKDLSIKKLLQYIIRNNP